MLLLVGQRLELVDALAVTLERVQLVVLDVLVVDALLVLRQDGESLAAVRTDPRGAVAVDHPLGNIQWSDEMEANNVRHIQ